MEDHVRTGSGRRLVLEGEVVGEGLALLPEKPVGLLHARVGRLLGIVAELHGGHEAVAVLHGAELVDAGEGRLVPAGDEVRAHAPGIHGTASRDELLDDVLIELVRHHDEGILEPGRVEDLAHLAREIVYIARVEAHAEAAPLGHELLSRDDRVLDARVEAVVGVDEEYRLVRIDGGIGLEGLELRREGHHPRMGHGARDGDSIAPACEGVRRGLGAARGGRAARGVGAVLSLGAPQAELHDMSVVR